MKMKITKYGHCCLLIEVNEKKLLIDPGSYSEIPKLEGIDLVLITHEHQDHLHVQSLQKIIADNPDARVITNGSVGKILEKEEVGFDAVSDGDSHTSGGVMIEGYGKLHAEIYSGWTIWE